MAERLPRRDCVRMLFFFVLCFAEAAKSPKLAVPNWLTHKTLGVGVHASPQIKHAAGKALMNFRCLVREKVLVKGENWSTKFTKKHAVTQCVGWLLGISYWTVQRAVTFLKERNAHSTLPEPKTRGRQKMTPEQYREAYGTVYNAILEHLKEAKKTGETIDVDKLLLYLREEEPGKREAIDMAYDSLRYYLTRMGFQHGRICRRLTSSRNKDYIIAWLLAYCQRRMQFATDPTEDMLKEVHFYVDESFLYRNDAGVFSWFVPGDQFMWGKPMGSKQRWGIVHGIFDWYEQVAEDDVEAEPARKRRKKDSPPDPTPPPGYVRKFETRMQTFKCWNCGTEGNMDTEKFMQWLDSTCEYFKDHFDDDRILVVHMDNASYHKSKNPKFIDVDAANVHSLAGHVRTRHPATA